MKLNKFFVLLILIINSFQIMPMEQEEEMPSKMEQKEFVGLIQKLPEAIKEEILKYVLSTDPKKIKSGIVFLQKLASTSEFANAVNDPIFLNWAIPNIASKLGVSIVDAAIDLGTDGASDWLKVQAQINSEIKTEIDQKLIKAAEEGLLSMVRFLLDSGADVNAVENNGYTALMNAARKGYVKIVELLLERGADKDKASVDGWTALMNASAFDRKEIVDLLIDKGADINKADKLGRTALMIAVIMNKKDIVDLLLKKGADSNLEDNEGRTAFGHAIAKGQKEIIDLL